MSEPRALTAALASPVFVTRGGGAALHAADRHVDRWAPEVGAAGANRIRPLRNLGFVDRLVSPWIESAQRSASMRMFSQYISTGMGERPSSNVSWVFPRPWYQDELDWMTAARQVNVQAAVTEAPAPTMLTTRGTYVAPQAQAARLALPTSLHEYVAPSLSIARPDVAAGTGIDAYSPLVSMAAAHAARMMTSAVAPLVAAQTRQAGMLSPNLRAVLTSMLERSSRTPIAAEPTRSSAHAPELVTPPAPRPEMSVEAETSSAIAERYAEQRARIAELQRVARVTAERDHAARTAAPDTGAKIAEIQQRATEAAARRDADARQSDARREATAASTQRLAAADAERARLEERIAQRFAERSRQQQDAQRLHETAREAAARDARAAITLSDVRSAESAPAPARVASELATAVAALPPELASMVASSISQRPDRAAQAIAELGEALRVVELLARTSASGGTIESSRGPRVVMPAGLGGLVSMVERTTSPVARAPGMRVPAAFAQGPGVAPRAEMARVPAMTWLAQGSAPLAPTSALGSAMHATPAALHHVAWSDRWLARFAGAQPQSLDVFTAGSSAEPRTLLLAGSAPGAIFVAPSEAESAPTTPSRSDVVRRYDDAAETPDDVLFAIAAAATGSRPGRTSAAKAAPAPAATAYNPMAETARETLADLVAHAAPSAPGAGLSAQLASSPFAPALRHVLPLGAAPSFDVRSLFGSSVGATYLAGLLASPTDEISIARSLPAWAGIGTDQMTSIAPFESTRDVAGFEPTYVAPTTEAEGGEGERAAAAPLTTLRSALLAFDVETLASAAGTAPMTHVSAPGAATSPTLARTMLETLSLPMLGDAAAMREPGTIDIAGVTAHVPSYGAPGMIADRAHAWSVAQERSTADLAFDFVSPELVLAARVYGLGPAEAAQAARIAIAGPGQLTAMAGAVDRTFVQAMAIEAERRQGRSPITTAYPVVALADGTTSPQTSQTTQYAPTPSAFAASPSAFGVERRTPRGSFLWPAATTAALGLSAPMPDGEMSMSVAALELLAAQAVAELGTYSALGEGAIDRATLSSVAARASDGATAPSGGAGEASDEDLLASAAAFVPASRRDKFQALYLALSQSPSGRSASPAARAARALALAGRGEETITARERASIAWDVLPVVYGQQLRDEAEMATLSTGEAAQRLARRREELRAMDPTYVDGRPGLSNLSARAGEALGSYVAPSTAAPAEGGRAAASSSARGEQGAVLRAPTAAPELVQTGRPAGRHGGGELELPAWFEQAARKMLTERSGVAGDISLAELTLVTSTPAPQIAAASRGPSSSSHSHSPSPSAHAGAVKQQVDIDKLANDVYREVLVLMDVARARNGEPYL